MMTKILIFCTFNLFFLNISECLAWGFFAHRKINEQAVYILPSEISGFYRQNMHLIIKNAVLPDKRRFINPSEAPRHYIDIDHYGDSAVYNMPMIWKKAIEKYTEDTLKAYGIAPWHISLLKYQLTEAFREQCFEDIIRISTDLGHYVADINVPLHTTENYNGQLTGQKGIHAFWESRLPELFFEEYNLFGLEAEYIMNTPELLRKHLIRAHLAMDSVLKFERILSAKYEEDKKYEFERKGKGIVKAYSRDYSREYHDMLNGMVERQMRAAIFMLASIWYTSWVDAGQPNLPVQKFSAEISLSKIIPGLFKTRDHE